MLNRITNAQKDTRVIVFFSVLHSQISNVFFYNDDRTLTDNGSAIILNTNELSVVHASSGEVSARIMT